MSWQYRTILFEYQNDGLLGDRYIDDEEMEKILNEQGEQGWELVGVSPVQEGLLSFFKRPRPQAGRQPAVQSEPAKTVRPKIRESPPPKIAPASEPNTGTQEQKMGPTAKKKDTIGTIRIS